MFYKMIEDKRNQWLSSAECTITSLIDYIVKTGQMRDTQIEAIQTYLFLKIACEGKPLATLFKKGVFNSLDLNALELSQSTREYLLSNPSAAALFEYACMKNDNDEQVSVQLEKTIKNAPESIDYNKVWNDTFYGVSYTDYLFSLPMGAGKTYLMAAFIYLDLYFAINEAHDLLYRLGYKLIERFKDQDVNLISGYGLGVGPNIVEGAAEAVANNDLDFGKKILIYPFPKTYYCIHSEDRSPKLEEHFKHYREKMIEKCGIAFFLFGNKRDKAGNIIVADGVVKEFEIAHKQGKYVFPIGSTGGAAKILADKVLANYASYNKTSLDVERLYYELNLSKITADEIIEKICAIIDLIAYRDDG